MIIKYYKNSDREQFFKYRNNENKLRKFFFFFIDCEFHSKFDSNPEKVQHFEID